MLRLNFANTVSRYGIALLAEFRGIAPGRWGAGSSHSAARQPALAHWMTLWIGAVRNPDFIPVGRCGLDCVACRSSEFAVDLAE
ncbi:Hypp9266 [Branchiostoma lanceolatum]|uniref:Hypp9266 protein n=1 Tax=Branchiostoma lanceolatum TaxID=7740 RepID=A0A8K0EL89_BRALA|nr:Hypp9266 [Branchiostoma lanceolatum]